MKARIVGLKKRKYVELEDEVGEKTWISFVDEGKRDEGITTDGGKTYDASGLEITRKIFLRFRKKIRITGYGLTTEPLVFATEGSFKEFFIELQSLIYDLIGRITGRSAVSARLKDCGLSREEAFEKELTLSKLLECRNIDELLETINRDPLITSEAINTLLDCFWGKII